MEETEPTAAIEADFDELIAGPPSVEQDGDEYALLELSLDFPKLNVLPHLHALWMRLFVITRDPLSWIADRGHAWAVAITSEKMIELNVYIELEEIQRALDGGEQAAALLGRYGETAMRRTFEHELLLAAGEDTPLLAGLEEYEAVYGVPGIRVRSKGWEPIGLGALQDLVREAFGDVALDRSPVVLAPAATVDPDCPACEGLSFGFPADVEQASALMCDEHRTATATERILRLARARESNPGGWRAIDKAAARVSGQPEPIFAPQPKRSVRSVARNDPCPCGSGLKYKRCHGA